MTREQAEKEIRDNFTEVWADGIIKALEQEPTQSPIICHTSEQLNNISATKNDLGVDWDELKRKILMEVDGGTDDAWLAYGEVCNRISNSIDEFVADMREVEE